MNCNYIIAVQLQVTGLDASSLLPFYWVGGLFAFPTVLASLCTHVMPMKVVHSNTTTVLNSAYTLLQYIALELQCRRLPAMDYGLGGNIDNHDMFRVVSIGIGTGNYQEEYNLGMLHHPIVGEEGSRISVGKNIAGKEPFHPRIDSVESLNQYGPKKQQCFGITMIYYMKGIQQRRPHAIMILTTAEHGHMQQSMVLADMSLSSSTVCMHFYWGLSMSAKS